MAVSYRLLGSVLDSRGRLCGRLCGRLWLRRLLGVLLGLMAVLRVTPTIRLTVCLAVSLAVGLTVLVEALGLTVLRIVALRIELLLLILRHEVSSVCLARLEALSARVKGGDIGPKAGLGRGVLGVYIELLGRLSR